MLASLGLATVATSTACAANFVPAPDVPDTGLVGIDAVNVFDSRFPTDISDSVGDAPIITPDTINVFDSPPPPDVVDGATSDDSDAAGDSATDASGPRDGSSD